MGPFTSCQNINRIGVLLNDFLICKGPKDPIGCQMLYLFRILQQVLSWKPGLVNPED